MTTDWHAVAERIADALTFDPGTLGWVRECSGTNAFSLNIDFVLLAGGLSADGWLIVDSGRVIS